MREMQLIQAVRVLACMVAVSAGGAGAAVIDWTNPNPGQQDWGLAANWNPAVVPGTGDVARFANSIVQDINVGSRGIQRMELTSNFLATFQNGTLTFDAGGSISTIGATTNFFASLNIVVTDGLTITNEDAFNLSMQSVISGNGGLVVRATGTNSAIPFANANTYAGGTSIETSADGRIGLNNALGLSSGAVTVEAGGANFVSAISTANSTIANDFTLLGDLRVDEAFENGVTLSGLISGAGNFIMTDGGAITLTANNTYTGRTEVRNGTLVIDGGTNASPEFRVGVADGDDATLILQNGAGTTATPDADVGIFSGTTGLLRVTGAGTTADFGRLEVGEVGTGTLEVLAGAAVTVANGTEIGADEGGVGEVLVSGAGSELSFASQSINFGRAGTGSLMVAAGGLVELAGPVSLGVSDGGVGNFVVTGAGSVLQATAPFTVGVQDGSTGSLEVLAGGAASSSGPFTVAAFEGSSGTVEIDGAGSELAATGPIAVGSRGTGTLTVSNGGLLSSTVTVLLGSSATAAGIVNVGDGAGAGIVDVGTILGGFGTAVVNFDHNETDYFFTNDGTAGGTAVVIAGSTSINHLGPGTTTLTGASTYNRGTTISAGTLRAANLTGSATGAGAVTVFNGGTLGGTGTITGPVTVTAGGIVAPGASPGTLTVGDLGLGVGAVLDFELSTPGVVGLGVNDLIVANGDLTLDGILNITDAGGFGSGTYRLINYTGAFTDNGLDIGTRPAFFDLAVDVATAGEVNLVVTAQTAQFWDGANTVANGVVNGGTGTWDAATTNWTTATGDANGAWLDGVIAVFAGTAGDVTVADGFVADVNGLDFRVGGYSVDAAGSGQIEIAGATSVVTAPGATTISAPITGAGELLKDGAGTLTLSGANTHDGGTTVLRGALVVGSDTAAGTGTLGVEGAGALALIAAGVTVDNAFAVNDGGQLSVLGTADGSQTFVNSSGGATLDVRSGGRFDRGVVGAAAIEFAGPGTVLNAGAIELSGGGIEGVNFGTAGGTFVNFETGNVLVQGGGARGIHFAGGPSALRNDGMLEFFGGSSAGIVFDGADATVTNSGSITHTGDPAVAIRFNQGGLLENTGTISEGTFVESAIVGSGGAVTVNNRSGGRISSNSTFAQVTPAISLEAGGSILNEAGATISGQVNAITAGAALSLVNAGAIDGNVTASGANDDVTLITGGVLAGDLDLGAGTNRLALDGPGTQRFSQAITGATTGLTALEKTGSGTWILDREVAPTGGTTVSAGALQIGDGGTAGSLNGNVRTEATLAFDRSDAATFAGEISGAGEVVKRGRGTLTLTGRNTYGGGTRVQDGRLRGDTRSLQGAIRNDAEVELAQSGRGAFNGTISGEGSVEKSGNGTLTFNGVQRYSGETLVRDGGLNVNGTLASQVVRVAANAVLGGIGTLAGDVIVAGLLSPGNSPGLLRIGGDLTQRAGGETLIEIASRQTFDRIAVSGRANLDGTVRVSLLNGFQPEAGDSFLFLTADNGVSGRFARLVQPAATRLQLVYGANSVTLVLPGSPLVPLPPGMTPEESEAVFIDFVEFAETRNQIAVATALDEVRFTATGDLGSVITTLNFLPEDELRAAFDDISPQLVPSFSTIAFTLANAQNAQLEQRMSAIRAGARGLQVDGMDRAAVLEDKSVKAVAPEKDFLSPAPDNRWGAFVTGSGTFAKVTNIASLPRYRFETGALLGGLDYRVGEDLAVGVYAGYAGTRAKYSDGSSLTVNAAKFGTFATYEKNGFHGSAAVGGGSNSYAMTRQIEFGNINCTARSRPDGLELDALLSGGYDHSWGNWTFGLTTSLQYTYLGIGAFDEQGADSLNVRVAPQHANSLRGSLGGRIAYTLEPTAGVTLIPEIRMSWQHEFLDYGRTINAWLENGSGPGFDVFSDAGARNNVFGGAGVTLQVGDRWSAYTFYYPQFAGGDVVAQTISAGLGIQF